MTDAQQRNATQQFVIGLIELKWIGKADKDSILGWFVGFVFIIVSILLPKICVIKKNGFAISEIERLGEEIIYDKESVIFIE